ncbi:cryptochrome/photolyase family protein [Iamia majanohamensis]|uniref:Cryptochrome/photolyase family protein n=1 Tax=Iamia majanohamensis TaxID=467976 RepID=A0AAE9Y5H9_9ACTN|nr:cryptochrome/photolyase family protein [Iamia majanohamensis]WCO66825.1 cryptochrome/photolyase family protein [Iamia majanohamensis]
MGRTTWVFGDQLNRRIGALADADPDHDTILLVESRALLDAAKHRQRGHMVLTAMRRFADELADAGFTVDVRRAATLADGLEAHRAQRRPDEVVATEPLSWDARRRLDDLDVAQVRSDQFLCHEADFAEWAGGRGDKRLLMEDFYRWQRRRLGYLMDGDDPVGGVWNLDSENREPPPKGDDRAEGWPQPVTSRLDDVDEEALADLGDAAFGAPPDGWWPTTRRQALARLRHVVREVLPRFGPHEDAMLTDCPQMAHSLLSAPLNIGLLLPGEVADAAEEAYRAGDVPLASAEGFIRQVIGWREYVWGLYWLWMPDYRDVNALQARRPLPPAFRTAETDMACLRTALEGVRDHGWVHHIQRLMVLANLSTLAGTDPKEVVRWMTDSFVDGQEWVMLPNVLGMGLHADGGRMATKPYVSGGAYINRMSDHCRGCRFDPKARTGDDACPYTTLYWDFLARHRRRFEGNHRMARPVANLDRLGDLDEVRARADEVRAALEDGTL